MKLFRSPRGRRSLAGMLAGLLIAPQLVGTLPHAQAQSPAVSPSVYVLDFNNTSRTGGPALGRLAAQRFALQLQKTEGRAVVADAKVTAAAAKLELEAPYDRQGRMQLAGDLGATEVVYGTLTAAKVVEAPKFQGYVRMMVLVENTRTGALVQGVTIEGTSAAHKQFTGDKEALIQEALDDAATRFAVFAGSTADWGGSPAGAPVRVAAAGGGLPGRAERPIRVAGVPVVPQQAEGMQANPYQVEAPTPVVVDAPGVDIKEEAGLKRRRLISQQAVRQLVGGLLFMGLLYVGGMGGIAASRPF